MPLDESRTIHELAYLKVLQDKEIHQLEGQKVILQQEVSSIRNSFMADLAVEKFKSRLLNDNAEDFKKQIASFESQLEYTQKKERKARRQRNAAIVIGAILIVLAVVK